MNRFSRRGALKLMSAGAAGVLVGGCGLNSGSAVPLPVRPGSITPVPGLRDARLTVGSKDFTEQIILAYIAEFALLAAGAQVRDLSNIPGSETARNTLVSGQIDVLWDYTGASWISYNGKSEPIPDKVEQFEAVRELDRERNGVVWTAVGFDVDNTYAFAVNQEVAKRLGVSKLSDLKRISEQTPQEATFCVETEFANRNDGLPGVAEAYGFSVDQSRLQRLSTGTIYQATAAGKACNFGEVFSTDGRIQSLNLKVLADDKSFFPRYNAGITFREDTLRRYPALGTLFQSITRRLNNAELMGMNAGVDVDGRDPADVARDWMVEQGFVTLPSNTR